MLRLIIILIFMVPFATLSNIWSKADGPFKYSYSYTVFNFNDELYTSTISEGNATYKLSDDEWVKQDTGFFSNKGIVYFFNQKENVVFTSTDSGIYLSYDYGKKWKYFETLNGIARFEFVTIVDQTIFLQSYIWSSLYRLDKDSDTLIKLYTNEQKTDSLRAQVLLLKDNYLFAVFSNQYSSLPNKDGRLYVSNDSGETWSLSESMKEPIISLILHNEILFAFTLDKDIFKSTDNGETWTTDTNVNVTGEKVISYKDLLFAGANDLNVSSDNGKTWEKLNNGKYVGCNDMIINNDKLYLLTNERLIYTFDYDKKHFDLITPITDDLHQGFIKEERDTLFSTGGYTVNYSSDNGASWQMYSDSLYYNFKIWGDLSNQDSIFVVQDAKSLSIYISTDYGKTWKFVDFGLITKDPWIGSVIIMRNRILLTSQKRGNRYSKDAGQTWEMFDNELFKKDSVIYKYFRINETDLILYAKNGLYKTNDNGLTWEYEKTYNEEIRAHGYSYREGNNIYSRDVINSQIYKSTDLGRTWINLEIELDSGLIWTGLIPYNGSLILLTMTDVYVSDNEGKDWRKYEVDILRPDGQELYFHNGIVSGDYLVMTSYYGNWRAKLSDLGIEVKTSVESEIERNYLYTFPPYPLPAKSEVKVLFYWDINLPMTVDDISIYDLNGQKISTNGNLRLEKEASHKGNIIWDCSSAESGVYIINIKHGTEEKSVKVMVE